MSAQELEGMEDTQAVYVKLTGTSKLPAGVRIGKNKFGYAVVVYRGTGTFDGEESPIRITRKNDDGTLTLLGYDDAESIIKEHAMVTDFIPNARCQGCGKPVVHSVTAAGTALDVVPVDSPSTTD